MEYAKLIDGEPIFAPRTITIGQTHYNPTPAEWLAENGYKLVRYTEAPEQEGYYAEQNWTETDDEIVQTWELFPLPDEVSGDEFLAELEELL